MTKAKQGIIMGNLPDCCKKTFRKCVKASERLRQIIIEEMEEECLEEITEEVRENCEAQKIQTTKKIINMLLKNGQVRAVSLINKNILKTKQNGR